MLRKSEFRRAACLLWAQLRCWHPGAVTPDAASLLEPVSRARAPSPVLLPDSRPAAAFRARGPERQRGHGARRRVRDLVPEEHPSSSGSTARLTGVHLLCQSRPSHHRGAAGRGRPASLPPPRPPGAFPRLSVPGRGAPEVPARSQPASRSAPPRRPLPRRRSSAERRPSEGGGEVRGAAEGGRREALPRSGLPESGDPRRRLSPWTGRERPAEPRRPAAGRLPPRPPRSPPPPCPAAAGRGRLLPASPRRRVPGRRRQVSGCPRRARGPAPPAAAVGDRLGTHLPRGPRPPRRAEPPPSARGERGAAPGAALPGGAGLRDRRLRGRLPAEVGGGECRAREVPADPGGSGRLRPASPRPAPAPCARPAAGTAAAAGGKGTGGGLGPAPGRRRRGAPRRRPGVVEWDGETLPGHRAARGSLPPQLLPWGADSRSGGTYREPGAVWSCRGVGSQRAKPPRAHIVGITSRDSPPPLRPLHSTDSLPDSGLP